MRLTGQLAWLTLDMLKSGTRNAGVAVRENSSPHSREKLSSVREATENSFSREWGDDYFSRTDTPALRVPDFNMSSVSQAR